MRSDFMNRLNFEAVRGKKLLAALSGGADSVALLALLVENREKYGCNIPWLILFDPTSACNMHCEGCWSGTYGPKHNLTFADMDKISKRTDTIDEAQRELSAEKLSQPILGQVMDSVAVYELDEHSDYYAAMAGNVKLNYFGTVDIACVAERE